LKTRLLPEVDVARIASLPPHLRRKAAEQFRFSIPRYSYACFRRHIDDIFNIQPSLPFSLSHIEWKVLDDLVRKETKKDDEYFANSYVAHGLHKYVLVNNIISKRQDFPPLSIGLGQKLSYWLPLIAMINGMPFVIYIDPRRRNGLNQEGRRFVFSVMHEQIRVGYPDFSRINLAIIQFQLPQCDIDNRQITTRKPIIHVDSGVSLMTLDQLETAISETLEIWKDVCNVKADATRRKSTGTRGPLI